LDQNQQLDRLLLRHHQNRLNRLRLLELLKSSSDQISSFQQLGFPTQLLLLLYDMGQQF